MTDIFYVFGRWVCAHERADGDECWIVFGTGPSFVPMAIRYTLYAIHTLHKVHLESFVASRLAVGIHVFDCVTFRGQNQTVTWYFVHRKCFERASLFILTFDVQHKTKSIFILINPLWMKTKIWPNDIYPFCVMFLGPFCASRCSLSISISLAQSLDGPYIWAEW